MSFAFDVEQCKSAAENSDKKVEIIEFCNCFSEEISKIEINDPNKAEVSSFLNAIVGSLLDIKKQYGDQKVPQTAVFGVLSSVTEKTGIKDVGRMMELMKSYGTPAQKACKQKIN